MHLAPGVFHQRPQYIAGADLPYQLALLNNWSPALAAAHPMATCAAPTEKLGTTVDWVGEPNKAAPLAAEQNKLMFVIQVSGNFAREEFT